MKRVQFECLVAAGCLPAACWRADGTFFNANDAFRSLLGYSGHDINAGKIRWPEITPPEYQPLDEQALVEIRQLGKCWPFEKEYVGSDGSRIPVLVTAAAFGKGVVDAGSFCAIDLRRRKRLPEADHAATAQVSRLSARQRLICLLGAYGVNQKRIATTLDIGLRTVELERHRAAKALDLPTPAATIWAVSNRQLLHSSAMSDGLLTSPLEQLIDAGNFPLDA
ncbi:MAG TPA: PAS domain-containing protein [Pirellulaceae bacterium]